MAAAPRSPRPGASHHWRFTPSQAWGQSLKPAPLPSRRGDLGQCFPPRLQRQSRPRLFQPPGLLASSPHFCLRLTLLGTPMTAPSQIIQDNPSISRFFIHPFPKKVTLTGSRCWDVIIRPIAMFHKCPKKPASGCFGCLSEGNVWILCESYLLAESTTVGSHHSTDFGLGTWEGNLRQVGLDLEVVLWQMIAGICLGRRVDSLL